MRQLRGWADLSYRQLERRASEAGDVLPRATVSGVLAREDLPREELLTAFVRACGVDAATVDTWLEARRRLAMAMEEPAAPDWGGGEPRPDPEPHAVAGTGTGTGTDPGTNTSEDPPATQAAPPSAAEPASDVDPGVLAEDVVREGSATTPKRANSAPAGPKAALRRVRRGGVAITVAVAIVVLTATATDLLRPRGDTADPRDSPTSGPSVTVPPERTASPSSAPETSKDTVPKPPEDEPEAGRTRDAGQPTSAEKTTRPKEPQPTPSSWTPPPPPYEPPPSYTPPPDDDGDGDPFPEETCWDVTNDCV